MNAGLRYLLRKQLSGWLRRLRRRARGPKGALAIAGAVIIAVFLIGPQVFVSLGEQDNALAAAESFRLWGPPALTLMAVLGMSSGTGIYFRPAEIDFLFPAPIGRRELLLYNVFGRVIVVFFSATWIGLFTLRHAPLWYGGFAGIFFGLTFAQLASQLASLALSTISARVARRARLLAILGLVLLLVACVLVMRVSLPGASLLGSVKALAGSGFVEVVCSPARVFVEVFTSATPSRFLMWAGGSLGILGVLFALIALLDIAYTDSAIRVSRKMQGGLQRMRSGGMAGSSRPSARGPMSLPRFAWFGGAGPIMWQKCTEALRSLSRLLLIVAFMVGFPIIFLLVMQAKKGSDGRLFDGAGAWLVVFMTIMMNQNLALDFRRDLDRMAYLKSLPLRPGMVALGQILPGAVLFTLMHVVTIVGIQLVVKGPTLWLPVLLLALLPLNWVAVALDNVLFLWMPYRFAPNEAGQVQFLGRIMVVMFAKMMALLLVCGLAALLGWYAWTLTGESLVAVGLVAAVVLGIAGAALTWLTGQAFCGFDDTKDMPG